MGSLNTRAGWGVLQLTVSLPDSSCKESEEIILWRLSEVSNYHNQLKSLVYLEWFTLLS